MIYTFARWADAEQTVVIGTGAEGQTETVPKTIKEAAIALRTKS